MSTITAWRITPARYQDTAFSGEGAKEYGGRFNRGGTPMVYTSESLALATLELLTKINSRRRATGRVCLPVRFDEAQVLVRNEDDLPEGWDARPYGPASQEVGDAWVRSQASLVLRVPSIVVPREHNYLINPWHPDASDVEIGEPEPLDLDPRILSD
jgi:RES domain-containing protein